LGYEQTRIPAYCVISSSRPSFTVVRPSMPEVFYFNFD
jgi:hypothetical protein